MITKSRSLLLCPWPGVNELRAMYVIEAGEEVIIAIENSQNINHKLTESFVFCFCVNKTDYHTLRILVKGDDQLPSHGGGGWRGQGGQAEVSQVRDLINWIFVNLCFKHFCPDKYKADHC